ncbi:hypothetical protein [Nesterenkonia natronophila]|uniref:Leucine rich repeat variant domain-containing protein n=1 Tax=Nesterenkonia natronophila TaxID=2174932 RepID=A0A3A4FHM3_9MICC|nr:hypothetical protein [Nesterenkonia natronophila]RJN31795.1 hypothetical protein D3250_06635 [Nesterenkonia natronophila]
MTQDPAAQAADPTTSHAQLYELVRARPDLRPIIAENPNTYPELREWLAGLGEPEIDAALARRHGAPDSDHSTQVLPTDEFGAVHHPPVHHAPTQPVPQQPRPEFDQQVFGSPAGYAAEQQPAYTGHAAYTPGAVTDPDEGATPRRRRGGAGVLVFLLGLLTVGALAATYFLLMGNPFGDDEPAAGQPNANDSAEQDDDSEQTQQSPPGSEDDPEQSPAPEDDDEADDDQQEDDAEFERPVPDEALSITEFSSPTGNINCQLDADDLRCTVTEYNFDAPEDCEGGVTFRVSDQGPATIDCSSSVSSQTQQLQYGELTGNTDFACEANEMFFECWSQRTGEGFEIAREYYEFTSE